MPAAGAGSSQGTERRELRGTLQPVKADVVFKETGSNLAAEAIPPSASDDGRSSDALPRKRAKTKGGKGTKRKKKENAQPELDIVISHEPE